MKTLTAQDRSSLIRLASSLPSGSPERKAILAGLQKVSYGEDWRERSRRLSLSAKHSSLIFRNQALRDLWEEEFTGQISDGMWENTPYSGFEFWSNVPTSLGPKTQLVGGVPSGVKQTFGFDRLIPIIGDRMLQIIQKTEPEANMGTVVLYTKEIMKALSSARAGKEAPEVLAPAGGEASLDETVKDQLRNAAMKACLEASTLKDPKPVGQVLMYNTTGGREGKYHYFLLIQGYAYRYQAISAYGSVGKMPKTVVLTMPGVTSEESLKAIRAKAKSKLSSGYVLIPAGGTTNKIDIVNWY